MNPSDLHHLSGAYALNALDLDERRAFEAHYPSCEICSREVEQFQATAAVLAAAVEVQPPTDLRARVLAEVSRTRQVSPLVPRSGDAGPGARHGYPAGDELAARRRRRPERWLGAVAAVALVAASVTVWLNRDDGVLSAEETVARVMEAPDALVTTLDVSEGTEGGSLQVVWSRDRNELAVVGDGLAPVGEDSVYELWLLDPDGAAPAGLFEPDDAGRVRTVLPLDAETADGFGVTIEPEGGSEQPTPPILYQAEL